MNYLLTTHAKNDPGFTVLYAMVVVSAVVLLGTTLTGIFLRGSFLVSSSQASTQAFYAADTALECAIYYDREEDAFSATTSEVNFSVVDCGGTGASDTNTWVNAGDRYRSFILDSDEICAGVTVAKYTDGGDNRTRITVRGRNTCENTNDQAERALRTSYYGH